MAAKVGPPEKPDNQNKKTPAKTVTKGRLRQALNVKLNQMIFNQKKPGYHKGKLILNQL